MAKKDNKDEWGASGSMFVACAVIGVGIGMLTNNMPEFAVLGVGVGFLVMGLFRLAANKK